MRVVFLDIDGVLNRTRHATHVRVDPDLVDRLRRLVLQTDALIVLSTFWRHFEEYIKYVLNRHGIPAERVIGRTPGTSDASSLSATAEDQTKYADRAAEIHAWLCEHPVVSKFVILDDRPTAADEALAPYFVQTDAGFGLTESDLTRCFALLEDEP